MFFSFISTEFFDSGLFYITSLILYFASYIPIFFYLRLSHASHGKYMIPIWNRELPLFLAYKMCNIFFIEEEESLLQD
jgi:hypothetical protein